MGWNATTQTTPENNTCMNEKQPGAHALQQPGVVLLEQTPQFMQQPLRVQIHVCCPVRDVIRECRAQCAVQSVLRKIRRHVVC